MIIGTAGHVNHGKTTLVKALTGVDCDVLEEEKRRGMTIQLGFARWRLPDGRAVSVIDVPGHARLARTMATGALGMDAVLLVVAADEGVMPQTREHLGACLVLGVRQAVVALTRIDRVTDAESATARVVRDLRGTVAQSARLVPVCAPQEMGLEALGRAVAALDVTPRKTHGAPLLLPLDRAFSARGHGTVATGSLLRGCLSEGDSVALFPGQRELRVRGLHVHGMQVPQVEAGQRVGLNLPSIKPAEIPRGSFLGQAGEVCVGRVFDAELQWLAHLPRALTSARSLGYVCGAARARARVRADLPVQPGSRGSGRVVLDRPVALAGGLHFVLRGPGTGEHGAVVGGGRILDAAPPRRRSAAVRAALASAPQGPLEILLDEAGAAGVAGGSLRGRLGLAVEDGGGRRLFSATALEQARNRVLETVDRHHHQSPDEVGIARAELEGRPADGHALSQLVRAGDLQNEGALVRRPGHEPRSQGGEPGALAERLYQHILETDLRAPKEPELLAAFPQAVGMLREALRGLERDKRIVRCEGFYFPAPAVERIMAELAREVLAQGQLPVSWLKEHTKLTRKHAIPLWTLMDRQGVTVRRGDVRVPGPRAQALRG